MSFVKCIRVIKDNAFVSLDYPLCVILEDYLLSALQAKAVEVHDCVACLLNIF
jgi:hypothetical protein